jgi:hypothetical protein
MDIGMLWFDNDPKSEVTTKITRATAYYRDKYGEKANLCFVHPSMVDNGSIKKENNRLHSGAVEVRTTQSVLPNHFWIGVNGNIKPPGR